MSSLQSDFRRLMSEIYENTHKVIIHDPNLMDVISTEISPYQEEDGPYILDDDEWERFQQIADRYEVDAWEEYKDPMDEMSTSSAAGAYNASLNATPKQYKGPEFEENFDSGYKEVKGFRAGHTKDKGGFQYKDLWNVNEREETKLGDLKIGDKIVIDKSVNSSWNYDGFGKIVAFHKDEVNGDQVIVDITNGGGSTFTRPGVSFPKEKISLQQGEIKKKEKKEKAKEMEKEPIKEGLKTEIKVRSKKQQFQEATKLANKKLREINTILEFASNLKQGLNETEYSSSSKAMESMKKNIAEAYKKMKNL